MTLQAPTPVPRLVVRNDMVYIFLIIDMFKHIPRILKSITTHRGQKTYSTREDMKTKVQSSERININDLMLFHIKHNIQCAELLVEK